MWKLFALYFLSGFLVFGGGGNEEQGLLVYAYDSFVAEWGLGNIVSEVFVDQVGETLEFVSGADAIAMALTALSFRGDEPHRPDVVVGIDNNTRFLTRELFRSHDLSVADTATIQYADDILVPYDFGYIAIVYDREKTPRPPESLEDLTHPRFAKSLVLMDPRSSSPGLAFLYWTIATYGEEFLDYWKRLNPSLITITDSWSMGYGMLVAEETPMVLSYTTSPVYHQEYENSDRYQAARFAEGHYLQVEYAGITRYAQTPELAQRFLELLVSQSVQQKLPLTNIMYPVRNDILLPDSFLSLGGRPLAISLTEEEIEERHSYWIDAWVRVMSE